MIILNRCSNQHKITPSYDTMIKLKNYKIYNHLLHSSRREKCSNSSMITVTANER